MKNYLIYILLIILAGLIIYILMGDLLSNRLKKSAENPYAYKVDEFKEIDPDLIRYKEVKRIALNIDNPRAIQYYREKLAIAYENQIQVIDMQGIEQFRKTTNGANTSISVSPEGEIFLGCQDRIERFDLEGNLLNQWITLGEKAYITAIAFKEKSVFVADAGNQLVYQYDYNGALKKTIDGRGRLENDFGFVVPSPYFELTVNDEGELWVVNPGLHYIENYSDEGTLRAYWGETSFDIGGFTGCCNPAHLAILPDGSFVTSEKGLVRIKVHKPSGELDCVVAGPKDFEENAEAPDITTDPEGRIYALDISLGKIRIFERITS